MITCKLKVTADTISQVHGQKAQHRSGRVNYRLTEKGIDLAPVLLELLIWGARHERTGVSCAAIESMAKNRKQVLARVRRRWQQRDPTPLLPQPLPQMRHRQTKG